MKTKDVVIVGGGISGLSALHFIKQLHPEFDITLYESDKRLGGTIGTDHIDGYSFDWGPNGFLDREPLTLRMCDEIGLKDTLERANERVNSRFILRKGKLRRVPMSPKQFLTSDILALSGKLRIMMEPFSKPRPDGLDETIYDFAKRHIGIQAADYMLQPMVSGIYGGVADRLSLKSCFPIMREMEDEYGSLFKAMIGRAKKAKAEGRKSGGPSGPSGWLTSFKGGLYAIIERFHSLYADHIVTNSPVSSVMKDEQSYTVALKDGTSIKARQVVLALPTNYAANLVLKLSPKLASEFSSIPYAPISVICLGYEKKQVQNDLDGFGFLVPSKEGRRILGSIWTSSIFAERSPEGHVQFRTMIGGDGDHESMNLSDNDLLAATTKDLNEILGIDGPPQVVKIYRWAYGIPQFVVGHSQKLAAIESELDRLGNLYVTGNAYYGIGLNDCVKQSYKIAQRIS